MKAYQVRLPESLWERLAATIGEKDRPEFIRAAIESSLGREELLKTQRDHEARLRALEHRGKADA